MTLSRSSELAGDLPRALASDPVPRAEWIELDDGRPARAVGMQLVVPTPLGAQSLDVVVARDARSHEWTLTRLGWLLFAAWAAASAGGAAVLYVVVRRGLAPIDRLGEEIRVLDVHKLDQEIGSTDGPTELEPVVDQLNGMILRLRETFEREQAFTAHAAHELRTPLSGLRSTLELALIRKRSTEEHEQAAERCLRIALELQSTVDALLELSRPDDDGGRGGEVFQFIPMIEAARGARAAEVQRRELRFELDAATDPPVTGNPALVTHLVENLVDNAVEHSQPGCTVRIRVRPIGARVSLVVSNPAPELSAEDGARAVEAFWRADRARTNTGRHTGLGLSLARRIARRQGGRLKVRVTGGSFVVRAVLPGAEIARRGHARDDR